MKLSHFDVSHLLRIEVGFKKGENDSWTPLQNASYHGDLHTVRYLISREVDLEKVDDDGWTPLIFASSNGQLDIVHFLISKGADVEKRDNSEKTALHMASFNGYLNVVQHLVSQGVDLEGADSDGTTPLHGASYNGHLDVVQYLIGEGADLEKPDNDGSTPLHYASYNGHLDVVQYLTGEGADLEKADNDGSTPLHLASRKGHLEVVQHLTGKGADLEKANNNGRTPLHTATYNGHLEVVQYLTGEGADIKKADNDGKTPLHTASYNGHLYAVEFLISEGAELDKGDHSSSTPLQKASYSGHLKIVRCLTGEGADIEKADNDGNTPLQKASCNGHLEVVKYLISEGAEVDKGDDNGITALHFASYNGHLEVVQYLVSQGADVEKADNDGRTPLSLASDQGHLDAVQYLHYKQQKNGNEQGSDSRKKSGRNDDEMDQELNEQSMKPKSVKGHLQQYDVDSSSDPKTIVERSSLGAGASTDESSQRVIRLEKYQIEVQVPPSDPGGVEDITVRAITEVPLELLEVLQDNEAVICVGLEMTPSDAKFSTPVKVTMPHSAIFTRLHTASIGTYCRKKSSDSFSLISFTHGDPRCVVRERDLDLYIDHFSEWWIIAFITRTFFGKRVICTPFVPESSPRNDEHLLWLCIRDNNKQAKPKPGYLAPINGEEFFIAWRSGEFKVSCIADNKDIGTRKREEKVFHTSAEVNIPFVVNTRPTSPDKSKIFVEFILEQSATIDIICPMSFTDIEDGSLQASSSPDSVQSHSYREESQTPETLGRTDSPGRSTDQMSLRRQTLPDLTHEDGTQSSLDSQEVTDVHLLSLSTELLPGHFSALYVALGISAGIAESIRVEKMNNYPETYMHLLQLWKAESRRTLADLDQVLVKAKTRGLRSKYKL